MNGLSSKHLRDLDTVGPDGAAAWDGMDASGLAALAGIWFLPVETASGASYERLVVAPR